MAKTPFKREAAIGRWKLPTKAVNGLLDSGVDETTIDNYTIDELMECDGFGKMAARMLRDQRAKETSSKVRGAVTREANRAEAKIASNVQETVEGVGGYEGESRDLNHKSLDFLKIPDDKPVSRTLKTVGKRLIIDVGPEHGLGGRHAEWMERIVQIAPPEMLIDSLERLIVVLVRGAMANDPSKGGTVSVDEITGEGIKESFSPTIRV